MNHDTIAWLVLIAGSLAAGASIVGVLVARKMYELPIAVAGTLGFGAAVYALSSLPALVQRADAILWAFVFMIASIAGGYALASTMLHRLAAPPPPPEIRAVTGACSEAVVVIAACIEPREYDPAATAGMLSSLADEGLADISIGVLPFLFFAQKARYRAIAGHSPSVSQLDAVVERLARTLPKDVSVSWAPCSGANSVVSAVASAVNRGCARVIVASLGVAYSTHFIEARNAIADLRPERHGTSVTYTDPLFDSDRILTMLASRVMEPAGDGRDVGVVLVGHGQPEPRAHINPAYDEQELTFLSRLRMLLLDRGLSEEAVKVAWADWSNPDISSVVRHLVAMGRVRVFVLPAAFPLDTLSTRLDLELAVRQARISEGASVVMMPAWRDEEAVIAELHDRVVSALDAPQH